MKPSLFMKRLKKRYIAIIAASTAVMLFGSLICCAISAFPELLETDEQKNQRLMQEAAVEDNLVVDVVNSCANEAETFVANDIVDTNEVVIVSSYIPSYAEHDVVILDEVKETNFEPRDILASCFETITREIIEKPIEIVERHFEIEETPIIEKEEPVIEEIVIEEKIIEENVIEEEIIESGESLIVNEDMKEAEKPIAIKNEIEKAPSVPQEKSANQHVIEGTILMFCVVEILPLIFLKRRRLHR